MTHAREMMIQQCYRRDQGYLLGGHDGLSQVRARVRIQIAFQETSDVLEGVYMPPIFAGLARALIISSS